MRIFGADASDASDASDGILRFATILCVFLFVLFVTAQIFTFSVCLQQKKNKIMLVPATQGARYFKFEYRN